MNVEKMESIIETRMKRAGSSSPLIPILQEIQEHDGYLSDEAMRTVSSRTGYSESHVYGVATFYHQFRLRPEGKHRISICRGTACHVAGATDLYNMLVDELSITPPEDTTSDGLFTIHEVRCIGACSLAPVIKIDDEVYGRIDPKRLKKVLDQYREAEG